MKKNKIILSNKIKISEKDKCFIIAEAGVNHNGRISLAKKLIDIAVEAKADAVKFQTFLADEIILRKAPKARYHIETTGSDKKQSWFNLLRSQEINYEMHKEIIKYCKQKKIIFMSTPYDKKSADLLDKLGMEIFKIASTDSNNHQLIEHISKKKKPVILSTAMSNMLEVEKSVKILKKNLKDNFILMQCTGSYPAPASDANLKVIQSYKKKFNCIVGYSDHVVENNVALGSIAIGAKCFEKHITVSKKLRGPDHRASMEMKDFVKLVRQIRDLELALGNGTKKVMNSEINNVKKLKKYFVANRNIKKGENFTNKNIVAKRTGGLGIKADNYFDLVKKKSNKDYYLNDIIKTKI
jgi:N,N'-diacetyllegionaminate synthase